MAAGCNSCRGFPGLSGEPKEGDEVGLMAKGQGAKKEKKKPKKDTKPKTK